MVNKNTAKSHINQRRAIFLRLPIQTTRQTKKSLYIANMKEKFLKV